MRGYIDETHLGTVQALRAYRLDCAVGSSGTIENLAEIASRVLHPRDGPGKGRVLSRSDLGRLIAILRSRSTEERRKIPGMNPERADIIVAGAAILESLMESLSLDAIHASDRGLREGLLIDYLQREEGYSPVQEMSVRKISVLRLARLFRVDESHANTTTRLALNLFDSGTKVSLHQLDEKKRELLEYATILHDAGSYLAFDNHELHSSYIIRNGELLGFSEQEIAVMAYIARYHRKYLSPKQAKAIKDLDPAVTTEVRVLANLLCLANSLDRSHTGVIKEARFISLGRKQAHLELHAQNGCELEDALADFGVVYAEQNERDHAALIAAIRSGRIEATSVEQE